MKYEKFDVERALAGEPVVLRNGTKAYVRYREEGVGVGLPLVGVELGRERWETWTLSGSVYSKGHTYDYDIVGMYPKEPLTMPNSFWELLTPETIAIAKIECGLWFGYEGGVPVLNENGYWVMRGMDNIIHPLSALNPKMFPDCEHRDSLILRPPSGSEL